MQLMLDVFCQSEARSLNLTVFTVQCLLWGGGGLRVKFWDSSLK
jgi:hypothetical protein